ncbi:hypothetical protein EDC04DRAFT_2902361 [Pisolithus marmoratus]|nr:hypothetical protein EDC04DRAFT_2902361 [Pisolithus marmoratus]
MPFLHHHGTCSECNSYAQHFRLAIALNEDGLISSMSQLADLAAGLIQCMKLDKAWEANKDLQVEIKDLHNKLGDIAPQSSNPSIPPQLPVTSDKQFTHDFECAHIASLGGLPHHDQPGIGTSSSMQDAPLPNTFSLRGRVQVKQPAEHKGKQKQPSPPQVEPACPPMEDEITPGNLYTDIPMTIDEPIIQGTMCPNFNGTEYSYRALCLGQGNDNIRLVLFMRINDNLYTYGDKMISKVIGNMNIGVPPPIPTHKQSVEEICKLYTTAYDEPEDKAPCIHKAQDLVMYLNLWKRCRLEMNEVMDLALKTWRPPIWASQKVHQKREVLRDKERASQAQAREGWIVDAPPGPSAAAAEEPRPIMPFACQVVAQPSGVSVPNQYQRPLELSQLQGGAHPSGKKARGAVPKLPYGAPSAFAPVDDWVKFIHQYQNQSDDFDESSKLSRMFPGALGFSSCPDDDEVEYRAFLEWAEVTPAVSTPVPLEGGFTHLATMANVATYLAANGIMYHDPDDAIKWAQRAGNEYIAQIISNGGDKDPNTKVIVNQIRAALNELLPIAEQHSLAWIDLQAHVLGVPPENIVPYEACPIKERDLYFLEEFVKSVAFYDLPHHARWEGNNAGGVLPIPAVKTSSQWSLRSPRSEAREAAEAKAAKAKKAQELEAKKQQVENEMQKVQGEGLSQTAAGGSMASVKFKACSACAKAGEECVPSMGHMVTSPQGGERRKCQRRVKQSGDTGDGDDEAMDDMPDVEIILKAQTLHMLPPHQDSVAEVLDRHLREIMQVIDKNMVAVKASTKDTQDLTRVLEESFEVLRTMTTLLVNHAMDKDDT